MPRGRPKDPRTQWVYPVHKVYMVVDGQRHWLFADVEDPDNLKPEDVDAERRAEHWFYDGASSWHYNTERGRSVTPHVLLRELFFNNAQPLPRTNTYGKYRTCGHEKCVNPWHFDMPEDGKCRRGLHDIADPENVYVSPQGHKTCKACTRDNVRRYREYLGRRNQSDQLGQLDYLTQDMQVTMPDIRDGVHKRWELTEHFEEHRRLLAYVFDLHNAAKAAKVQLPKLEDANSTALEDKFGIPAHNLDKILPELADFVGEYQGISLKETEIEQKEDDISGDEGFYTPPNAADLFPTQEEGE